VGASADEFDGRWHVAIADIPPMPASKVKDPLDLQDPNGVPALAMVPSQEPQAEPDDFASVAKPSKERALALVVPKPPARPRDPKVPTPLLAWPSDHSLLRLLGASAEVPHDENSLQERGTPRHGLAKFDYRA